MAHLFGGLRGPQCLSCFRRFTGVVRGESWFVPVGPTHQQVRGKKKVAKQTTIKVRLLADIPRYGRKGSIIPIAPGRMRNFWLPSHLAEYVTNSQLQNLGHEGVVFERDFTFGLNENENEEVDVEVEQEHKPKEEIPAQIELDMIKPARALRVLDELLPDNIDFYRTPIAAVITPPPQRQSPSLPASSAISAAAREGVENSADESETPARISIYGSVTSADIISSLKAILVEDGEGERIVISPEDITFVDEQEENDRIKHLGVFEIDIAVKGVSETVRRTIRVNAQE